MYIKYEDTPSKIVSIWLSTWFDKIEIMQTRQSMVNGTEPFNTGMQLSLIVLKENWYLNQMYDHSSVLIEQTWKQKWMDMRCANIGCNVQRNDKELRICKGCRAVRYCSKKCQKVDWKKNNHKRICREF